MSLGAEGVPFDEELVWRVGILANGTLQLLASPANSTGLNNPSPLAGPSPDPILTATTAGQPVVLHIAALGADLHLEEGGQVTPCTKSVLRVANLIGFLS